MSRRSYCKINLTKDIDRIVKTVKEKVLMDLTEASPSLRAHMEEGLEHLRTTITEGTADRKSINDHTVGLLTGRIKRDVIDLLDTYKAAQNITKEFDSIMGTGQKKRTIKEGVTTLFQNVDHIVRGAETWFGHLVDVTLDNLATAGKKYDPEAVIRAKEIFYGQKAGNNSLHDFLKSKSVKNVDEEIYFAYFQGSSKIPELDLIVKALKKIDDTTAKKTLENAPYFNIHSKHVLPLILDKDKIKLDASGALERHLLDTMDRTKPDGTKMSDAEISKRATEIQKNIHEDTSFKPTAGYRSTTKIFGFRKFHFTSLAAEWKFLKNWGKFDGDVSMAFLKHRQYLLTSTALHSKLGPDLNFVFHNLREHIIAEYPELSYKEVTAMVEKQAKRLETTMGLSSQTDEFWDNWSDASQNVISYAFTGQSAVRNVASDSSVYSSLNNFLMTGEKQLPTIAKYMWAMMKSTVLNKKGYKQVMDAAEIFESQTLAIKFQYASLYDGYKKNLQFNSNRHKSLGGKAARRTEGWKASVSKWSGADWQNRSTRVFYGTHAGRVILKAMGRLEGDMKPALRGMLEQTGLSWGEFKLLNKIPKVKIDGVDTLADFHKFDTLTPEDTKPFLRPLETHKDVVRRLQAGYHVLQTELTNYLTSLPSRRGQIHHKTETGWLNLFMRSAFNFTNIQLSQWYNLTRSIRMGTTVRDASGGLDVNVYHAMFKNPKMLARVMATHATGGMLILWAQDLLNGKTPRAPTPENLLLALFASGFSAPLAIIYGQIMYSRGKIGTPLLSLAEAPARAAKSIATGSEDAAKRNITKSAEMWVPFLGVWWAKPFVAMAKALGGVKPSRTEKRLDKESSRRNIFH